MAKPTEDVIRHQEKVEGRFNENDGAVQLLRDRNKKPSDVAEGWEDVKMDEYPDGDMWVDVYNGPLGEGYVVNYSITKDGVEYVRSVNVGPEKYRTHDWQEVIKEK